MTMIAPCSARIKSGILKQTRYYNIEYLFIFLHKYTIKSTFYFVKLCVYLCVS